MVLIAVVDAQMKGKGNTEEAVKKSPLWKRFKKVNHEI